jgi:glutaredoxin
VTVHVKGKYEADLLLYALSTCGNCKSVKRLLNNLGVEYDYIDVDLLYGDEKERVKNEMRKWNPRCPFPMLVINNSKCIIGDEPDEIKVALNK